MPRRPYQAATMVEPARLQIFPNIETRDGSLAKDARLINCYVSVGESSGVPMIRKRLCYKTPTFALGPDIAADPGHGLFQWVSGQTAFSRTISIFGTTLTSLYNGTSLIGLLNSSTRGLFSFTPVLSSPNEKLYLADENYGYVVTDTAGVLTSGTIIDANYPGNIMPLGIVPGCAYTAGKIFAMKANAVIYQSDGVDTPDVWDVLGVIRARHVPGYGVALAQQGQYIIALKSNSTEVFTASENPPAVGSILTPILGATKQIGCLHGSTVTNIDDALCWVTSNVQGNPKAVLMADLTINVISTEAVEKWLAKAAVDYLPSSGLLGYSTKKGGNRFYVLTSKLLQQTLVYDLDHKRWYQWRELDSGIWPFRATVTNSLRQHVGQHLTNGHLYEIDIDSIINTDNGGNVESIIYTPNFDGGVGRNKTLTKATFNVDINTLGESNNIFFSYSDDDYENWSPERQIDLQYRHPQTTNLGTFYRRAFKIRHFDAKPLRLSTIDLQLDIGLR